MSSIFLLAVTGAAVLWDIKTGRIPNLLIAVGVGLACWFQIAESGMPGFWRFLGGSTLPLLLLAVLFYFRMFGAGDMKLFCVIGGFLGIEHLLSCMAVSFLTGAIISLVLMIRRRILKERLLYFLAYIGRFYRFRKWVPYRNQADKSGEFCFAIPIFFSVLLTIGGVY